MTKFFSLMRAILSQDMDFFRYKAKKNASDFSKLLVPLSLSVLVMFSIGTIYASFAVELNKVGLIFIILSLAIFFPSILTVMEGIYKSQSILFEAKDNDLLFSLPISKKMIILGRIFKLYLFQLYYGILFSLPGILIYIFYEKPTAYFYVITILMILLFPIIPTVIGCFIGYIIKRASTKFKNQKIIQLIFTFAIVGLCMAFSFNQNGILNGFIENASQINEKLTTYYFPLKAYLELINEFNIITFIELIAINALAVLLFVFATNNSYFGVVSRSKEFGEKVSDKKTVKVEDLKYTKSSQFTALLKKEFNKYFSSTVYMINTLFGLLLLLISTIGLCANFNGALAFISNNEMSAEEIEILYSIAPKVYIAILIAMSFMTSITSSSISLEGRTFNILKSLPTKIENILFAKVMMSNIITIPIILVCDIIVCCSFSVTILDIILIFLTSFIAPSIAATFGLLVNLKYPKMDASSDTEIIKQSMSSMVAVFGGILFAGLFFVLTFIFAGLGGYAMIYDVLLLAIILLILWLALIKYGKRRFKEIEV